LDEHGVMDAEDSVPPSTLFARRGARALIVDEADDDAATLPTLSRPGHADASDGPSHGRARAARRLVPHLDDRTPATPARATETTSATEATSAGHRLVSLELDVIVVEDEIEDTIEEIAPVALPVVLGALLSTAAAASPPDLPSDDPFARALDAPMIHVAPNRTVILDDGLLAALSIAPPDPSFFVDDVAAVRRDLGEDSLELALRLMAPGLLASVLVEPARSEEVGEHGDLARKAHDLFLFAVEEAEAGRFDRALTHAMLARVFAPAEAAYVRFAEHLAGLVRQARVKGALTANGA
jgi:hypothetical protein